VQADAGGAAVATDSQFKTHEPNNKEPNRHEPFFPQSNSYATKGKIVLEPCAGLFIGSRLMFKIYTLILTLITLSFASCATQPTTTSTTTTTTTSESAMNRNQGNGLASFMH